jgi:hypothetical protein
MPTPLPPPPPSAAVTAAPRPPAAAHRWQVVRPSDRLLARAVETLRAHADPPLDVAWPPRDGAHLADA